MWSIHCGFHTVITFIVLIKLIIFFISFKPEVCVYVLHAHILAYNMFFSVSLLLILSVCLGLHQVYEMIAVWLE